MKNALAALTALITGLTTFYTFAEEPNGTSTLEARLTIDEASPFCTGAIGWSEVTWYHVDLLRLAASYTSIPFTIIPVCRDHPTEEGRMRLLHDGTEINTAFFGTTPAYEADLLPVYFPVFLGTTGLRVLVTRPETTKPLSAVKSLADIQHFSFGQEGRWPDFSILEYNGLDVVDARYRQLHRMLMAGRFDLYPRAYWEAASELDWIHTTEPEALINKNIALYYPMPIYFFVSPDQVKLQDAIFDGLIKAYEDGAILKLLRHHPQTARSFEEIPIDRLTIINLINPELTSQSAQAIEHFGIVNNLERDPRAQIQSVPTTTSSQ